MFIGKYQHNIDDKGRLIIPSNFREELGSKIYVCGGFDNCLYIFPEKNWNEFMTAITTLRQDKQGRQLNRYFLSSAADMEMDKQGRVVIPPHLREQFNLKGNTYLIGIGPRIELWNAERYEENMAGITPDEIDAAAENLNLYF